MHTIKVPIWEKRTFLRDADAVHCLKRGFSEIGCSEWVTCFLVGKSDEYHFFRENIE